MRLVCWNKGGCKNNSNTPEYYGCGGETEKVVQCCAEYNGFYGTIEALKQEKEVLVETILQLKDENKQLRVQVARMVIALKKAKEVLTTWLCAKTPQGKQAKKEALAAIEKAIGGKAIGGGEK